MKETLRQLFLAALEDLSLRRVMNAKIKCREGVLCWGDEQIELERYKKIVTIAIGKAAFQMAEVFAETVRPRTAAGLAVSSLSPPHHPDFVTYQGGHPYPNLESVQAAERALETLSDLEPHHLVVYLLSGGGSAICEKPISDEISIDHLREFYRVLVTCGANIVQMNVLRKHFSAIKGGRLAERAFPARQVTFYVSDVPPRATIDRRVRADDAGRIDGRRHNRDRREARHRRKSAGIDPRFLPRPPYPRNTETGPRGLSR